MDVSELLSEKQSITIPNPKGGEGLEIRFAPDAITPYYRRKIIAMTGADDEAESAMIMLEALGLEWNLRKEGQSVLPLRHVPRDLKAQIDSDALTNSLEPEYPPTLLDVPIPALFLVLNTITEAGQDPKATTGA